MDNELFDIRDFEFYQNKNIFSGSLTDYSGSGKAECQYKIVPDKANNVFKVYIWLGKFCMEKSELLSENEFPFTEEGFAQVKQCLINQGSALGYTS